MNEEKVKRFMYSCTVAIAYWILLFVPRHYDDNKYFFMTGIYLFPV
jgi:hypothetical protein